MQIEADKLSPSEARSSIIDKMQGAIRDLAGMVPQDQRHISDDYVRILEHCTVAARDVFQVMQQLEAALYHADRSVKRRVQEIQQMEG